MVDAGFLQEHDVDYWAGPRSLPLWLPEDALGLAVHDVSAAFAAGLTTRPIADTARDTLAWLRATEDPTRTGLTRAEERNLPEKHPIRACIRLAVSHGPVGNPHFPCVAT